MKLATPADIKVGDLLVYNKLVFNDRKLNPVLSKQKSIKVSGVVITASGKAVVSYFKEIQIDYFKVVNKEFSLTVPKAGYEIKPKPVGDGPCPHYTGKDGQVEIFEYYSQETDKGVEAPNELISLLSEIQHTYGRI